MKITFYKCNCNGNSFIILVNNNQFNISSNQIKSLCKKTLTDGLIFLNITSNVPVMNYYNNDGTWETFCLNGLACSAYLLNDKFKIEAKRIECNNIIYPLVVINDNNISVEIMSPIYKEKNIIIENLNANYIDSGAKHLVIHYTNPWINELKLEKLSRKIRYNEQLFPGGINVNYYKQINDNTIEVKTYEKGVESMMASCASGSYACAYEYSLKKNIKNQIKVLNDGGNFSVIFSDNYKKNIIKLKSKIEYSETIIIN